MKRHIIGVDIDGVILDLAAVILPFLSEACNRPLARHDLSSWDLCTTLDIDMETMDRVWKQLFYSDALRHAPPIDGAVNALSSLSDHEIWLVTSRPSTLEDLTLSWLRDNRVHYDHIVFSRRGNKYSAGPVFNVFIEDFLEETQAIASAGIFTILFNQPWNQSDHLPANCKRVCNWDEVLQLIDNL
jgi:uncharacterized HAD superfamily protein